jgi:hypothetical protein
MAGFYAAKLGIFKEVETEPDPNVQPGPVENPETAVEQPAQQNAQTNTEQQPETQESQPQDNSETNQNQQPPEEDSTVDTIPNEDSSATRVDPNTGGYSPQDANMAQQGEPSPVDGIKKKEEEIYANLTPEELDIKHRELKKQFLTMFDMTTQLVERINNISVNQEYISIIEYASNNLARLRTMLGDYMNSVYKTKSYTENHINYNRFLATLNGISKILEEINKNED